MIRTVRHRHIYTFYFTRFRSEDSFASHIVASHRLNTRSTLYKLNGVLTLAQTARPRGKVMRASPQRTTRSHHKHKAPTS